MLKMACKLCQEKPVWKFTNQQQLCSKCFVKYFENKIKKTIRKYNMPINTINKNNLKAKFCDAKNKNNLKAKFCDAKNKNNLKAKVINSILKEIPKRKGKVREDSLDDISISILYIVMYGNIDNLKKIIPKNQPLYFLSEKEILLYAKIKKIKGKLEENKNKRAKEISNFIKIIEQKNPDIRQNVVGALLKNLF